MIINPERGAVLIANRRPRKMGQGPAGRVYGLGRYPYNFTQGALPPDDLARQAMAIMDGLPDGSGVNPIGRTSEYPYPYIVPAHTIHIVTGYMGIEYDEVQPAAPDYHYYETHPVVDRSGLIYWTGPDTAIPAPNLSQAQALAYQVMVSGGDTSWSADFYPRSSSQTGGVYAPMSYDPGTSAYAAQQAGSTGTGTAVPTTTTAPTAPTAPTTTTTAPRPAGSATTTVPSYNVPGTNVPVVPLPPPSGGSVADNLYLPDSGGGGGGYGGGGESGGGGAGGGIAGIPWWLLVLGGVGAYAFMRKR